jgi:uncharacterized protein
MPRLKMRTADGVALAGRIRSVDDPRAAVVVVHGFTATQDHPEVLAVADALVAHRFDVVTYDGRGHGDSEGICTLGHHERADVAAAVAVARERSPHVVVVGASMGAIAALRYAMHDRDLAGIVTVSAPANWRLPRSVKGLLLALLTRTPPGRSLVAKQMNVRLSRRWEGGEPPTSMAARLEVPLAVIHGRADGYLAHTEASDLYDAARGPRRLDVIDGMGHAFDARAIPAIVDAAEWALSLSVTR